MNLNPEFLALKLSFGDEPQEKHALIRCRLSKEMDVGGFKPKPKPKPAPQQYKDEFEVKDDKMVVDWPNPTSNRYNTKPVESEQVIPSNSRLSREEEEKR